MNGPSSQPSPEDAPPRPSAAPPFPGTAFLALAGVLILHARSYFSLRIDDAFIVLRYADNLRRGLGMTFNPGERVEGFTCPGLVVIEAAFAGAGLDALFAVKVLGIACGVAVLWTTMQLACSLGKSRAAAVATGALLVIQPSLAVACVNGLETAPMVACVVGALGLSLLSESLASAALAGLLLAMGTLLRPDAALAAALIAVTQIGRDRHVRQGWQRLLTLVGIAAVIVVPLELWKARYFGSWIPNTAIAKVPAHHADQRLVSGLQYLWEFSFLHWEVIAWGCLAVLCVRGGRRYLALGVIALVWSAYVVNTGGDWMPGGRFLLPIVPLASIAFGTVVVWLAPRTWHELRPVTVVRALTAAALCGIAGISAFHDGRSSRWATDTDTQMVLGGDEPLAVALRLAPAGARVAALDVGALAYFSNLNVLDLGGLTDPAIARIIHDGAGKFRGHLFFPDGVGAGLIAQRAMEARPELIILKVDNPFLGSHAPAGDDQSPRPAGERMAAFGVEDTAFALHPEFRRNYRYLCSTPLGTFKGVALALNAFVRRDVLLTDGGTAPPTQMVHCPSGIAGTVAVTTPL